MNSGSAFRGKRLQNSSGRRHGLQEHPHETMAATEKMTDNVCYKDLHLLQETSWALTLSGRTVLVRISQHHIHNNNSVQTVVRSHCVCANKTVGCKASGGIHTLSCPSHWDNYNPRTLTTVIPSAASCRSALST
jgi:hypothetical protein